MCRFCFVLSIFFNNLKQKVGAWEKEEREIDEEECFKLRVKNFKLRLRNLNLPCHVNFK
jgi:hypothetical protein